MLISNSWLILFLRTFIWGKDRNSQFQKRPINHLKVLQTTKNIGPKSVFATSTHTMSRRCISTSQCRKPIYCFRFNNSVDQPRQTEGTEHPNLEYWFLRVLKVFFVLISFNYRRCSPSRLHLFNSFALRNYLFRIPNIFEKNFSTKYTINS